MNKALKRLARHRHSKHGAVALAVAVILVLLLIPVKSDAVHFVLFGVLLAIGAFLMIKNPPGSCCD